MFPEFSMFGKKNSLHVSMKQIKSSKLSRLDSLFFKVLFHHSIPFQTASTGDKDSSSSGCRVYLGGAAGVWTGVPVGLRPALQQAAGRRVVHREDDWSVRRPIRAALLRGVRDCAHPLSGCAVRGHQLHSAQKCVKVQVGGRRGSSAQRGAISTSTHQNVPQAVEQATGH